VEGSSAHRDEMVVARARADGAAIVEPSWPADLPALPPGQAYDPRARILTDTRGGAEVGAGGTTLLR